MNDWEPRRERVVDVAQRMVDTEARPRLWINGQEVGPIEKIRFLEHPDCEILAERVWHQKNSYETIEVSYG